MSCVRPMRRERRRDDRKKSRGAAMVEFALVVPIFLALVFGIISYGYMLSYRQAVTQAASEGSRAAALAPDVVGSDSRDVKARAAVNRSLESYGVTCTPGGNLVRNGANVGSCTTATAACEGEGASAKSCVTVTVNHRYDDHPLIPAFPGLGFTLPSNVGYTSVIEAN